ncbi:MAG: T9SS type A sorting domain-containing protein, partial [Bacteroidota bacterium]|nr:T9SS type A sorting domain-containing protein [Bacteroidota bacterium]
SSVSSQTNISCNGGSNGTATILASGGTPSYTYAWTPSGGNAAITTGRTAGTYTCTITDANGCTRTQTVTLTQPTAITSSVSSQTNISCNGGSNGAATILASGGVPSYTYAWTPSGGNAATTTGRTAGTYTCTITDANGCTQTQTVSLTKPTAITSSVSSQTNISCNGGSNGTATILASGGTPSYTYAWAPSGGTAATATGLAAGAYTCTVTDVNTCTITQTLTLTQPTAIISSVTSQTNILCNGNNDGAATIAASGGTGTLTYAWMPSGGNASAASGFTAGTFTCTITDANSCTQTQTVSITEAAAIASSVSSANISCNGASDGTANVIASGGTGTLTYAWAPTGGTAAAASGLTATIYTCTITDQNGCTTTESITIVEPAVLAATVSSQTEPLCNGSNDGGATIAVTGGTGPNTYAWTPSGGNAASASGLTAGTYTCVVTDANACSVSQTVLLTEPIAIDITTTANGNTISANLVGASYQWIDCTNNNTPIAGETNQLFAPVIGGNYAVIISVGACSDTSICTNILTGIKTNESSLFTVFPNPANGFVTVQLEYYFVNAYFEIFNATGQLMCTKQAVSLSTQIELPEAPGIYLIRLNANGKTGNIRVINK